jgi:hypothetical protein
MCGKRRAGRAALRVRGGDQLRGRLTKVDNLRFDLQQTTISKEESTQRH